MRLIPEPDSPPFAARRTRAAWRSPAAARKRRPATRLTLEALEGRCLLSFNPAVNYPVGVNPTAVAAGDFNGDGRLDIVAANENSDTVSVLLGDGGGAFQAAKTFATGSVPTAVTAGDFNGDGRLDIVAANGNSDTVSVLLGNGDGAFQPARNFVTGSWPESVAVGDFNGDGKLDLVTANANDVSVLLGNGDGTLHPGTTFGIGSNPDSVAVGDFNGDGKLDLAVTSNTPIGSYYGDYFDGHANVLLGDGHGAFGTPSATLCPWYHTSAAVGDFNGDGKLDFATADDDFGTVSVLLGDGLGNLGAATDFSDGNQPNSGIAGLSVAIGDFNGDGKPDLAATNNWGVSILLGNGDGTFQNPLTYATGMSPACAAVGDFNGDGSPDLAVVNRDSNDVTVLLNAADWSTAPQASTFAVGGFPSSTTAGVAGAFTVTAVDAAGATATDYGGTVHFGSSDPQAGLPADYTFTASDRGTHTFSATLKTAGTQSLAASDTFATSLSGSESGIAVTPAAASHLTVGAPAGSTAGDAFSITLTARDPYNNTATGYTGTVHFTSTDAQASLPANYTFTAADAGVHAFSGVTLKTAGSQTVTARDTVAGTISGSAAVAVSPAAASMLSLAGFPSPITAGVAGSFTVTLKDPYGNIATGYTGTVHITSSDGKASLPVDYAFTAANAGVHTFSAILKTAGTQAITVADTATGSLASTRAGITVNPAAASRFVLIAPSSVTAGVPFSLTVKVEDAYGNIVIGYTGTVHFSSTDSTATLPADYTFTASDSGVHTFTGLALRKKSRKSTITVTDILNSSLTGSLTESVS